MLRGKKGLFCPSPRTESHSYLCEQRDNTVSDAAGSGRRGVRRVNKPTAIIMPSLNC